MARRKLFLIFLKLKNCNSSMERQPEFIDFNISNETWDAVYVMSTN